MKNTIDRRTLLAAAGLTLSAAAFAGVVMGSALGLIPAAHAAGRPLTVSPKRIAALDYAVLDMFTVWGETGRLVAAADPAPLGYLKAPEGIPLTGGLKTAPVAELQAAKPDLIVITGRLQRSEAELKAIAPVVLITPDQASGALESYAENMRLAAGWVGKQREADAEIRCIEARVKAVREKAAGATVAVLMVNEGRVGMLPPGGRCSLISREFGFTNVVAPRTGAAPKKGGPKPDAAAIKAGNEKTLTDLKALNPKYVFILNKDRAVGRPEVGDHRALLGAEGWDSLEAVREGRAFGLTDAAWYLGEGGPTGMDLMVKDVERALGI